MTQPNPILFTVGHSNRSIAEFISILSAVPIDTVIDVRAYPQSQRFPQFSQAPLRQSLDTAGIIYHWAGKQLGGMRKARDDSKHISLENESLRAYADYMESDAFRKAAAQLIHLATTTNAAVLCAEKLPEHCHRSLLSDYLLLQAVDVRHIIDETCIVGHQLSPIARRESLQLIYDRGATQYLDI